MPEILVLYYSHRGGVRGDRPISAEEKPLCIALGKRFAAIALKPVS